jgi:hypothetical protein
LAEALTDDTERLCELLLNQKRLLIRRALIAWERSPETFGEEIVALNDINETLRYICSGEHGNGK